LLEYKAAKERNGKREKAKLRERADKHPDWYLKAFAEPCNGCPQVVHNMFVKLGSTRKKRFTSSEKSEEKREPYLTELSRILEEKRV
jgi:hypothetical protein